MKRRFASALVMGTPVVVAMSLFFTLSSCSRPIRTALSFSVAGYSDLVLAIAVVSGLATMFPLAYILRDVQRTSVPQG